MRAKRRAWIVRGMARLLSRGMPKTQAVPLIRSLSAARLRRLLVSRNSHVWVWRGHIYAELVRRRGRCSC